MKSKAHSYHLVVMVIISVVFHSVMLTFPGCSAMNITSADAQIYDQLFTDHRPELRPVSTFTDIIELDTIVALHSILSLDSKEQSLKVQVQVVLCWKDMRLSWDIAGGRLPKEFVIPQGLVWTPDIVIRNSLSSTPIEFNSIARPFLLHHGVVCLRFLSQLETRCSVDVRKFPFDSQECQIQLSMPRSGYDNVKFKTPGVYRFKNVTTGDWILQNFAAAVIQESGNKTLEEMMALTLKVSRHYSTYMVNTLLPLLGLFFLNPSTSLLLSYAVTISSLSEILPGSKENVCYLSVLASVCFFISAFISMLVIMISRVKERIGLCRNAWGLLVLYICSKKYRGRLVNRKVCVVRVSELDSDVNTSSPPLGLELKNALERNDLKLEEEKKIKFDSYFDPSGARGEEEWQEVTSCLNRLAFVVTMTLSAITVTTFLLLMCT